MSKLKLSATLVLVALFGLPVTAQAAQVVTQATPSTTSVSLHTEDGEDEFEGEEDSEYEEDGEAADGEAYETVEEGESFVVPPVVIEPNYRNGEEQPQELGAFDPETYQSGAIVELRSGKAIRVDQVKPSVKTPTDLFVDSAVVGLGAVGAGALALGAMVGVRTIRARRNGEKEDYFYGE